MTSKKGCLPLEKDFEKWAMIRFTAIEGSFWPPKEPAKTIKGLPDRYGVIRGRFVALEFKRTKTLRPSALQGYVLERIRSCQGLAFCVNPDNFEQVFKILSEGRYRKVAASNRDQIY